MPLRTTGSRQGCGTARGDGSRTTDRDLNMCAVGRVMADTLNAAGLNTLHDETLNDYPSYTGSYANSRAVVQQYLSQYPSIKIVLDVHRDAIETENGSRMAPVCTVNGRQAAQVMIICGCDNGTTVSLPNYRLNLRFAAAWETAMEGLYPGFTRPVLFSYRFYNQDLTTGSLLIEIGGHGNNLNEALYAGQLAANGLIQAIKMRWMTSGIFDCLFVYDAAQDLLAQPNDLLVLLPHGIGAGDRAVGSQHNGIGSHHMGHGGSALRMLSAAVTLWPRRGSVACRAAASASSWSAGRSPVTRIFFASGARLRMV